MKARRDRRRRGPGAWVFSVCGMYGYVCVRVCIMDVCRYGCVCTYVWRDGGMERWSDGAMDGWTYGRMNGR